jgi:dTDP-4-amino-4,6-dideoxygalactose transaminase
MKVPFLDLRVTDETERQELLAAVEGVLKHGRIVLGPEVGEFEQAVATRLGVRYVVGVNSGTDALILTFRALGLGPGDEVIMPPLSFVATANTVSLSGATPVFADLTDDLVLDPASVEALITPRTKALVPVHWSGRTCDMTVLLDIAKRHNLLVIEDTAQAFDAKLNGRKAGTFGIVGCFSMNCMKVFASLGEAGAIATDDQALYEKLVTLRYHGLVNREFCHMVSHNGRLDTVQAAMLLVRLKRLDSVMERRQAHAAYYDSRLASVVETPRPAPGGTHVYYTYTIQTDRRDALKAFLEEQGVETKIQHVPLMPDQPVYEGRVTAACPNARRLMGRVLCLPASENLTALEREYVADQVLKFFD